MSKEIGKCVGKLKQTLSVLIVINLVEKSKLELKYWKKNNPQNEKG